MEFIDCVITIIMRIIIMCTLSRKSEIKGAGRGQVDRQMDCASEWLTD